MEVECREEAHIVVLFDNLKQLRRWQKIVDFSMRGLKTFLNGLERNLSLMMMIILLQKRKECF